jgi:iron complex outermembrane receptor protein
MRMPRRERHGGYARSGLGLLRLLGGAGLIAMAASVGTGAAHAQAVVEQASGVDDIIVTARRRAESIQDVPVAVSAIPPTQLEAAAAPDIRDLAGRTPTLVVDPVAAGPGGAAISIRGISFEDIEKSFDPAVGVLIDGVYIGTNTGQLLEVFDFESIEVLRGPQGTLFGRNTTAGVINIRRTRPTGELGLRMLATIGDYGRRDLRTVVNLPAFAGIVSTKLFWLHLESDDFYNNQTLGRDYGGREYDNFGVTFRVESGPLDLEVTYEHERERTELDQAALSTTPNLARPFPPGALNPDLICLRVPVPLPTGTIFVRPTGIPDAQCDRNTRDDLYTTFSNVAGFIRNDADHVTVNARVDMGGGLILDSVTGWRGNREQVRQDFDSTSINFFDTLRLQSYNQFSQELRLSGAIGDNLDFLAGFYYFNSSYKLDQNTFFGPFLQAGAGLPAQGGNRVNHSSRSTALFADLQWRVTDALRISVGGRQTWDTKRIVNDVLKTRNPALIAEGEADWSQFSPRASIDIRPVEDLLLYGSFARGYRAGGFNGRGQTINAARTPYDPETVDSFEIGLKAGLFDNRMTVAVAAFHSKYKDKQEEVVFAAPPPVGQETLVVNAAEATIKGLEFETRIAPVDGLEFYGSLGLLDAQYDSFATQVALADGSFLPVDASTRKLRRAPDVTAGVGASWTIPVGPGELLLNGSYRHTSEYQTTIVGDPLDLGQNDPRGLAQPRDVVDASATFRFDVGATRWRVGIFGRNLTDNRGLNSALPVGGLFTFGAARPPRTWGGEIGVEF